MRFRRWLKLVGLVLAPSVAHADVLSDWNFQTVEALRGAGVGLPQATRALAIAHLAAFDAVNAISSSYAPFSAPLSVESPSSAEAAAASALHDTFTALLPEQQALLDATLKKSLAKVEDGTAKEHGVHLGQAAAAALLALRQADGSTATTAYPGSSEPGKWQPTPGAAASPTPALRPADSPAWRLVTPFALTSPKQFRPEPPPDITSNEFTLAYLQVKGDGILNSITRSEDQTTLGQFWSQPVYISFNALARTLAQKQGLALDAEARLFALVNVALADALIATWDAKYRYGYWRPITAIQTSDDYGNPNSVPSATWAPLVETPSSPEYPSELSASGAAALAVFADIFGADQVSFSVDTTAVLTRPRTFHAFAEAEQELTDSAWYSGVNFRFSAEAGRTLGRQVATQVLGLLRAPTTGAAGAAGAGGVDSVESGGAPGAAGMSAEPSGGSLTPAAGGAAGDSSEGGDGRQATPAEPGKPTAPGSSKGGCALQGGPAHFGLPGSVTWGLLALLLVKRRRRHSR